MTHTRKTPETATVYVPFRLVKRGGRKEMVLPEGATRVRKPDNTLIKALARAFRWKRMLESGEFSTIADLSEREGIAPSFLSRSLRITLLAPNIVEAILDGRQPVGFTLETLREPAPAQWREQMNWLYRNRKVSDLGSYPLSTDTAHGYNPKHDESK